MAEYCCFCDITLRTAADAVDHLLEHHQWQLPYYGPAGGRSNGAAAKIVCWCGEHFEDDELKDGGKVARRKATNLHPAFAGWQALAVHKFARHLEEVGGLATHLLAVKLMKGGA